MSAILAAPYLVALAIILIVIWKAYRYPLKCAWCGCTVGRTSVPDSHGICPPCSETWLDDWRKETGQ